MAKQKRLTKKEIALRAEAKKRLQEEGILPPDKPRLNRKKFAREVFEEFEQMEVFAADLYLRRAIGCMVSEDMPRVSEEQVGVLKLMKLAVETQKFMKALEAEGRTQYTIGEYVDKVVRPVRNL
ncbi:addiction module toxin RelE [Hungatella hathewayi]